MIVGSELKEAQLEQISSANEATANKESGRIYSNYETEEILLGTGSSFIRFKKSEASIGDIKHSMLTEAQFQAEVDTTWVLADGRDVTGSDFETLTGFSIVPDCRGQFLRGANNGRSDGKENPDGGALLGIQQDDAIAPHSHDVQVGFGVDSAFVKSGNSGGGAQVPDAALSTGTGIGTTETRPKNITVNIFIKINRLP